MLGRDPDLEALRVNDQIGRGVLTQERCRLRTAKIPETRTLYNGRTLHSNRSRRPRHRDCTRIVRSVSVPVCRANGGELVSPATCNGSRGRTTTGSGLGFRGIHGTDCVLASRERRRERQIGSSRMSSILELFSRDQNAEATAQSYRSGSATSRTAIQRRLTASNCSWLSQSISKKSRNRNYDHIGARGSVKGRHVRGSHIYGQFTSREPQRRADQATSHAANT